MQALPSERARACPSHVASLREQRAASTWSVTYGHPQRGSGACMRAAVVRTWVVGAGRCRGAGVH